MSHGQSQKPYTLFQHDSDCTPSPSVSRQIENIRDVPHLQSNTTTSDLPTDISRLDIDQQYFDDAYELMEEILVETSESSQSFSDRENSLLTDESTPGFHFQAKGSVINFYCEF